MYQVVKTLFLKRYFFLATLLHSLNHLLKNNNRTNNFIEVLADTVNCNGDSVWKILEMDVIAAAPILDAEMSAIHFRFTAAQWFKRQDKKRAGRDTSHFRPCYHKTRIVSCCFVYE